jgi:hypothetical protein
MRSRGGECCESTESCAPVDLSVTRSSFSVRRPTRPTSRVRVARRPSPTMGGVCEEDADARADGRGGSTPRERRARIMDAASALAVESDRRITGLSHWQCNVRALILRFILEEGGGLSLDIAEAESHAARDRGHPESRDASICSSTTLAVDPACEKFTENVFPERKLCSLACTHAAYLQRPSSVPVHPHRTGAAIDRRAASWETRPWQIRAPGARPARR